MTHLTARIRWRLAGFSMVEVALALLILSIGVLTMVGLMSGGLDMSKSAVDYTQAAIFGSDTMEGVRFTAATITTNGNTSFAAALKASTTGVNLQPVVPGIWNSPPANIVDAGTTMNNFWYAPDATNVDFACRYRILIEDYSGLTLNLAHQVASVKLDVVNGLFGAAATQSFYTEVFQFVR